MIISAALCLAGWAAGASVEAPCLFLFSGWRTSEKGGFMATASNRTTHGAQLIFFLPLLLARLKINAFWVCKTASAPRLRNQHPKAKEFDGQKPQTALLPTRRVLSMYKASAPPWTKSSRGGWALVGWVSIKEFRSNANHIPTS